MTGKFNFQALRLDSTSCENFEYEEKMYAVRPSEAVLCNINRTRSILCHSSRDPAGSRRRRSTCDRTGNIYHRSTRRSTGSRTGHSTSHFWGSTCSRSNMAPIPICSTSDDWGSSRGDATGNNPYGCHSTQAKRTGSSRRQRSIWV